jgi:hypothetical protein
VQDWSDDEADNIDQPLAPILDVEVVDMDEEEEAAEGAAATPAVVGDAIVPPPAIAPAPSEATTQDAAPESQIELSLDPSMDTAEPAVDLELGLTNDDLTTDLTTADLSTADLGTTDLTTDLISDLTTDLTMDLVDTDLGVNLTAQDMVPDDLNADLGLTGDLNGGDMNEGMTTDMTVAADVDFSALATETLELLPPDGTAFEASHDLSQVEPGDDILGPKVMDDSGDPFANVA